MPLRSAPEPGRSRRSTTFVSVPMADAIVRGHRKRADLVGREVSGNGRAAGRIGMALIAVKNRSTGLFILHASSPDPTIRLAAVQPNIRIGEQATTDGPYRHLDSTGTAQQ